MKFDEHRLHKYEIIITTGLIILGFIMIISSIIGIEIHRTHAPHTIEVTITISPMPTPGEPYHPHC